MIEIKSFSGTDFEFQEITRLYDLFSPDGQKHIDDMKDVELNPCKPMG